MGKRQGRILVVDDHDLWRGTLTEILQQTGYYVESASTVGEARKKLAEGLFHLLILDLLMEGDHSDRGGLELLLEIKRRQAGKSIKVIMLSANSQTHDMRLAFKESIIDFIDKNQFDSLELLKELPNIFTRNIEVNLSLDISWERGTKAEQVVVGLEIGAGSVAYDTPLQQQAIFELDDLLCRLFFDAKCIVVHQLIPGHSGTKVLSVHPIYDEGVARPVIVKFGDLNKIEEEYIRFKKYAERYIGGGHYATTLNLRHTPSLGGIIYSLVGGVQERMEDFGTFCRRAEVAQIKTVLQQIFKSTCGAWYSNPGKQDKLDLSDEYQRALGFTWEQLHQFIADYQKTFNGRERLIFTSLNSSRTFTNPILATENQTMVYLTYTCITHGDFNQHNILVDSNLHTWLIDFQETGPGHILRDITALDVEIRCKLLKADEITLKELLAMEEALCSIERFDQIALLEKRFKTQNSALAKIYALVVYLRTLARQLLPRQDEDMSEYYAALLFHALNTIRFGTLSTRQREHALLSASLLVDKLNIS